MSDLSLDQPLVDFVSLKALHKDHPVFLIGGEDGSHLVIKREPGRGGAERQRSLEFAVLAMRTVSPGLAGKVLEQGELDVLSWFVGVNRVIAESRDQPM